MKVAFNGAYQNSLSFLVSGEIEVGEVVKMSGNGTVSACSAGDVFCGVCTGVEGDVCGATVSGVCKVSYSSTAPTVGCCQLCADGNGGVKTVASGGSGKAVVVINVDSTESTVEFLL